MKWAQIPYSFLGMRKSSEYSEDERTVPRGFRGKYVFVYPFVKSREWYALPAEERWRIMQGHIEVGREYPGVDNHTTYSFGLDDQEFVVAFDTDDVGTFLDLVQRLRTTEASRYTVRDTPSFTCIAMSLERALNALDGEPVGARGAARRCLRPRGLAAACSARADPVLAGLIDAAGPLARRARGPPDRDDHYGALVRAIVGQQLSVLAARAIYGRLTDALRRAPADARRRSSPTTPKSCAPRPACRARRSATCARWPSTCSPASSSSSAWTSSPTSEVIAELVAVKGIGDVDARTCS